jgi:hypothetical protein
MKDTRTTGLGPHASRRRATAPLELILSLVVILPLSASLVDQVYFHLAHIKAAKQARRLAFGHRLDPVSADGFSFPFPDSNMGHYNALESGVPKGVPRPSVNSSIVRGTWDHKTLRLSRANLGAEGKGLLARWGLEGMNPDNVAEQADKVAGLLEFGELEGLIAQVSSGEIAKLTRERLDEVKAEMKERLNGILDDLLKGNFLDFAEKLMNESLRDLMRSVLGQI